MARTLASIFIDGVEVTNVALEGSSTRRLNGVASATVRIPADGWPGPGSVPEVGALLKIYFDDGSGPALHHHGRILTREITADENVAYVVFNSSDPLELWNWRPVRDNDGTGDFSNPKLIQTISETGGGGPQIIEAMLDASEGGPVGATMPDDAEGPLFLKRGGVATGGVNLAGTPTDWPMTMAQLANLLTSTGEVDIVVTPIELEDSGYVCDPTDPSNTSGDPVYNYGQIDIFNGNYGDDLSASVSFQYGMGLRNIRAFRWNTDMARMCNKLWYYLAPRMRQQHWRANITGSQDFTTDFGYPGGLPELDPSPCPYDAASPAPYDVDVQAIRELTWAARCNYGVRMDIQFFEDQNNPATIGYCLFKRQWLEEQFLRAQPLALVHITPTRDTPVLEFDIGDLITVEITPDIWGGVSGVQRVYGYSVEWDVDSVCALSELQVSSDAESFPA